MQRIKDDLSIECKMARIKFLLDISNQSICYGLAIVNLFYLLTFIFLSFGLFKYLSNGTSYVLSTFFTALCLIIGSETYFGDGE
jgi:hypothetical protein